MKSSLEIAQDAVLEPIETIAERAGLLPEEFEPYGRFKAKVSLGVVERMRDTPDAKVVCVAGVTPTKAGEGKTTTAVSLTQGLGAIGKNPLLCLREPSLGPVFGIKGGAAGGGLAQVVPMEDLNLHFTGDIHAVGAANNLLAALLKAALKPNLIQTLEGQPCLMHCGPFANIAHGNSSLVADLIGMKLGEYVITESGFGSDMGMEKFFNIVCRKGGLRPSAVVLVATVRALKHHAGVEDDPRVDRVRGLAAVVEGAANLHRHLGIVRGFGLPCVVAVNRRPGDTDEEVGLVKTLALEGGALAAEGNDAFARGGAGAADLAAAVAEACEQPSEFMQTYADDDPIDQKIRKAAKHGSGASDGFFYPDAERKLGQYTADGLDKLPICMAKTHLSLSADAELRNAPKDFTVPVRDIRAYTGAGWLVPLCGDIMQMPGLGKSPAAPSTAAGPPGAPRGTGGGAGGWAAGSGPWRLC